MADNEYVATIGLEVHVQLDTSSKMFCACRTSFAAPPNTAVCPVCLGYPGALPVMNRKAVEYTVRAGLMLGCDIPANSKFDRKSYFYPDMPKNYQISQYDQPLCLGGGVEIDMQDGTRTIHLRRIHLEEDVAKNMHFEQTSGVDFNRAGTPLMEIVTQPDIRSADEALAFLQALKALMLYAGVSNCNLEQGNMRCDVNISMRPADQEALGTKAEIKNLNTFKGVHAALIHEIERQQAALCAGDRIAQETRRWDVDLSKTFSMRTKEDDHDYRYFPDPDLMPVVLAPEQVDAWRETLPEAPRERRARFVEQYDLPDYDAGVLVADKAVADYFEEAAALSSNSKAISNWMMTEMLRMLAEREVDIVDVQIRPKALAELVKLVDEKTLNSNSAKEVFASLFEDGGMPAAIVEEKCLAQVSDSASIDQFVDQAIAENPKSVSDYKAGKTKAAKFLVGQVMRLSQGRSNPQLVMEALKSKLDD